MSHIPVFILAGGYGTRLSEETSVRPKPMVEIGEIPILIHIMRHYYSYGFKDFVICAGYKSWEIKSFFLNYSYRCENLEIQFSGSRAPLIRTLNSNQHATEDWRVRVLDTGESAMTGARLARALDILDQDDFESFALTYGDGLCDVNLRNEYGFHFEHAKIGTVLGVRPLARFGELFVNDKNLVQSFQEKPQSSGTFINGGFFFFRRSFRKYLSTEDQCVLEQAPLTELAEDRELVMFPHEGFWHPMDTLRDKNYLQNLWKSGEAPWVITNKA
ncbi:MAG: sugar phosphate nucleotidyltransferase [Bdellovibrionales bacterium]